MATVVGTSAGSAAAGLIVDASGWRAALLVACAAAALGALLNIARRRTLQALVPAAAEGG